jgi:hypothetical protein
MSPEGPESFEAWVGRTDECADQLTQTPLRLMQATLDLASAGALPPSLPPLAPGRHHGGVAGTCDRRAFLHPPAGRPRRPRDQGGAPGRGDFARDYDHRTRGLASHFVWVNRSKESLTLDLKQPQALAALKD